MDKDIDQKDLKRIKQMKTSASVLIGLEDYHSSYIVSREILKELIKHPDVFEITYDLDSLLETDDESDNIRWKSKSISILKYLTNILNQIERRSIQNTSKIRYTLYDLVEKADTSFNNFITKLNQFLVKQTSLRNRKRNIILSCVILGSGLTIFMTHNILNRHQGLIGEYFYDVNLKKTYFVRQDDKINFDWGTHGITGNLRNRYSIRWTGYLFVPETGIYSLKILSDDGIRLWIDDDLVMDDWISRPKSTNENKVKLNKGFRKLKLEYFENKGYSLIKFYWKGPGDNKHRIVERRYLFTKI